MPTRNFKHFHAMGKFAFIALVTTGLIYGASRWISPSPAKNIAVSQATAKAKKAFPDPKLDIPISTLKGKQNLVLAGGCFWGMESVFEHLRGVEDVVSGFSGGTAATAHYEAVGSGRTGHAESVKITYDPAQISYGQLLKVYFSVAHNPTELNRQESDEGPQYRSAIFFATDQEQQIAKAYITQLNQAHLFSRPIVTQLTPLKAFYPAEDYHQNFIDRNPNYPYVVVHDLPKLKHLKQDYPKLYKN